jgi:molybdopterin-binding protein
MNRFEATITDIRRDQSLHIVSFECYGVPLKMMSLELDETVQAGKKVSLGVKATAVSIAKGWHGEISLVNQISAKIVKMEKAELLTHLDLACFDTLFGSVITTQAVDRMKLQLNDDVTALFTSSDLSIMEVL